MIKQMQVVVVVVEVVQHTINPENALQKQKTLPVYYRSSTRNTHTYFDIFSTFSG